VGGTVDEQADARCPLLLPVVVHLRRHVVGGTVLGMIGKRKSAFVNRVQYPPFEVGIRLRAQAMIMATPVLGSTIAEAGGAQLAQQRNDEPAIEVRVVGLVGIGEEATIARRSACRRGRAPPPSPPAAR